MYLETERLALREYKVSDLNDFHILKSTPQVWVYSTHETNNDLCKSEKALNKTLKKHENGLDDFHAVILKSSNQFIGEAGVISFNERCNRAVIGYNLLPEYWGYGYATEIVNEIKKYLFDVRKVERIEALTGSENLKSAKVLEKAGFKKEGCLRHFAFSNNKHTDVLYYGIIRGDVFQQGDY